MFQWRIARQRKRVYVASDQESDVSVSTPMFNVPVSREIRSLDLSQTHSLYWEELGNVTIVVPKRVQIPSPLCLTQTYLGALTPTQEASNEETQEGVSLNTGKI